jgi:hypothetical protein
MLDDKLEQLRLHMLDAEGELLDGLPTFDFDELLDLYNSANEKIFVNSTLIEIILKTNRELGQEAILSAVRVQRAILTEIEYRIKENKI